MFLRVSKQTSFFIWQYKIPSYLELAFDCSQDDFDETKSHKSDWADLNGLEIRVFMRTEHGIDKMQVTYYILTLYLSGQNQTCRWHSHIFALARKTNQLVNANTRNGVTCFNDLYSVILQRKACAGGGATTIMLAL